ncbi:MAG: F0F1 ATP synthase subunit gamma [Gammaproteobacteria bacterium]|nr:F0F1 ATP synthase subunit gamma [Gammaproteobacteria bacterium]
MAKIREIKTKIHSIKNTQKITRAMEMVAASKMRKTQQRMMASRPYAEKMLQVIQHIATASLEYRHPFLIERPLKRAGYIIVSSDSGLCGGLNNNLFRTVIKDMAKRSQQGVEIDLGLIGVKAETFFHIYGGNIVAVATHLGDMPTINDLLGVMKAMLDHYRDGKIDAIYLCFNTFVSTMLQQPTIHSLLPLISTSGELTPGSAGAAERWDYIYEPDAKQLLDLTLTRYIESQVYQAVLENVACKQAAQMIAMKNATDNANEIMDRLKLAYHKARQATITQELAEIVAGTEALE